MSETRAVYDVPKPDGLSDPEWRLIQRLRQVPGSIATIDLDSWTLHVATRAEHLRPHVSAAARSFLLVDFKT